MAYVSFSSSISTLYMDEPCHTAHTNYRGGQGVVEATLELSTRTRTRWWRTRRRPSHAVVADRGPSRGKSNIIQKHIHSGIYQKLVLLDAAAQQLSSPSRRQTGPPSPPCRDSHQGRNLPRFRAVRARCRLLLRGARQAAATTMRASVVVWSFLLCACPLPLPFNSC
jgi:hypothetical protein